MSKITNEWLNVVWHRTPYSCTRTATVGVKGLIVSSACTVSNQSTAVFNLCQYLSREFSLRKWLCCVVLVCPVNTCVYIAFCHCHRIKQIPQFMKIKCADDRWLISCCSLRVQSTLYIRPKADYQIYLVLICIFCANEFDLSNITWILVCVCMCYR